MKQNEIGVIDAIYEAQKIAFAPFVFQVCRILRDRGILTFLRKKRREGASIPSIHAELGISEYGLRILLELASTSGVVDRHDGEVYTLTKTGYFLDTDEMTKVNMDFTRDVCYKGLFHLEEALDEGKPSGLKEIGDWSTLYEGLSHFPEKEQKSWLNFDHFYSSDSFPEALPIIFTDKPKRLLDVGGNTGKFSIKCCEYDADVKVTIVDLPGQIKLATQSVEMHQLDDRIDFFPLNMLHPDKPFPVADAIWMSQFLDCFSEDGIVTILKHAAKTMDPATKLFIMETFWDNQTYPAATFSLAATSVYFTAIANGNSKMYGIKHFAKLIEKAGLKVIREEFPIGVSHTILTCVLK